MFGIEMMYMAEHVYILGDGTSTKSLYADSKNIITNTDIVVGSNVIKASMGHIETETGFTYQGTAIPDVFPMGH